MHRLPEGDTLLFRTRQPGHAPEMETQLGAVCNAVVEALRRPPPAQDDGAVATLAPGFHPSEVDIWVGSSL